MLTFLLDVNVGKTVRLFLQQQGYQVRSIIEINPRMSDKDILGLAHREKSILITCDKDFGELIFRRHLPHSGVIRLEDTTPLIQKGYLSTILAHHLNRHAQEYHRCPTWRKFVSGERNPTSPDVPKKILIGSFGDVNPYVGLALGLKQRDA